MNKICEIFKRGKVLIPYLCAGDPSLELTKELILGLAAEGINLIELGLPFSDPIADGVVIQKSHKRALNNDVTADKVFEMVMNIDEICDVSIALMVYANTVFVYGKEKFRQRCFETNIKAIIIPDLPFEEKNEFSSCSSSHDIPLVSMVSPASKGRIKMIAKEAEGFIYCISSLGVTGMRKNLTDNVADMVKEIKKVNDIPCAVGFGITDSKQAAQMSRLADGIIVGSAIVNIVEKYGEDSVPFVREFIRDLKKAIDQ